jgi:hypothetical protein
MMQVPFILIFIQKRTLPLFQIRTIVEPVNDASSLYFNNHTKNTPSFQIQTIVEPVNDASSLYFNNHTKKHSLLSNTNNS